MAMFWSKALQWLFEILQPIAREMPSHIEVIAMSFRSLGDVSELLRGEPRCYLRLENLEASCFRFLSSRHACDGWCLLDNFAQHDSIKFLIQVALGAVFAAVTWLRCLRTCDLSVETAKIFCVCDNGIHKSVFVARILQLVFGLLFQKLRIYDSELSFTWAQRDSYRRGHEGPNTSEVRHIRLSASATSHYEHIEGGGHGDVQAFSVAFDDCLWHASTQSRSRLGAYRLDLLAFFRDTVTSLYGPLADMLPSHDFDHWMDTLRDIDSDVDWMPVVHDLLDLFPRHCSICTPSGSFFAWQGSIVELLPKLQNPVRNSTGRRYAAIQLEQEDGSSYASS